ncbi:sulfotransferase domain-containing protein [Winogradskyella aquimaris]|uniref:Sulfotransferase domain-containing protein n=1 Tax=Winogradskyella aquimaris TaxID=864074 RepID=A0ABU5EJP9_9FLAO|nr:sulfotransferase domain-containing protein [Winogradskyella aquimaris]MDY2586478.1 sulfotransferase domain-containing protein [Winogradskyella aquimaris]
MKAKNSLDKYRYYFSKRIEIFFHSLKKSQIKGRKHGPKVILNSLPKSGTHLLESLFLQLPLMRHCGKKTLRLETQNPIEPKLRVLSSIKKGQFLLAHMQYHEKALKTINTNNTKIIHLVRDPRDVLLSHLNYIEKMDITQKSHRFITSYDSRFEKLKAIIEGKKDVLEPFDEVLDKFLPWTQSDEVLCIKFENLIGPNGGGDKHKQEEAVKSICNHISIELNQDQLENVCNKIYSVKSSTFNKGKIGNWRSTLSEEEKKWLNKTIENQITKYGYK